MRIFKEIITSNRHPAPGKVVHFAFQNDLPTIWFQEGQPSAHSHLNVVGTGQPVPDNFEHIATTLDGPFVWHLVGERL